jgi:hypothetical protein
MTGTAAELFTAETRRMHRGQRTTHEIPWPGKRMSGNRHLVFLLCVLCDLCASAVNP